MATVRAATHADIDAIVDMAERFYPDSGYPRIGPMTKEGVAGMAIITMQSGVMLVADDGGVLVGMLCLHVDPFLFNADILMTHELAFWIAPEHRGGMLAARMIRAGERAAKDRGAKWNRMATLSTSDASTAEFYNALGYSLSESYFVKEL